MEAKDSFSLTWCGKHENWWVTNCPDCMVDDNEPDIRKAGIREVVEWIEERRMKGENSFHKAFLQQGDTAIYNDQWQVQLKEWGIGKGILRR